MIESIFTAAESSAKQTQVNEVEMVAHKGIVGDRNFGKDKWPGQNVTFIAIEEIERFNAAHSLGFSADAFRRNIVTQGVQLNELVGKTFTIGGVAFYGVELCEPCADLGDYLASEALSAAAVVKALTHRAGLRADVLSNGRVSVGMALVRSAAA